jgi:hypothetical protein
MNKVVINSITRFNLKLKLNITPMPAEAGEASSYWFCKKQDYCETRGAELRIVVFD